MKGVILFSAMLLIGCGGNKEEKISEKSALQNIIDDSANSIPVDTTSHDNVANTSEIKNPVEDSSNVSRDNGPQIPKMDTTGNAAGVNAMRKADIKVKTFRNDDGTYGYDIIIDDIPKVHQPNVPAVAGNKGFVSEEKAAKAAQFVITKIRNNIMPPTVSIRELDSLGVR